MAMDECPRMSLTIGMGTPDISSTDAAEQSLPVPIVS